MSIQKHSTSPDPAPLPPCWQEAMGGEFEKPYMHALKSFLKEQKAARKEVYPHSSQWFQALKATPFDAVKVVILGQDPYHGPGQAHGLCFSVQNGVRPPPSLRNIYKEMQSDIGFTPPKHGCLEAWAQQGVLLLNSVLTVERARAASHQGKGWEQFTDAIIRTLAAEKEGLVFVLWGAYAQRKGAFIEPDRQCVLKAAHPSPFSAHNGFFGCRHFSKTNAYLERHGKRPVDWNLPEYVNS